MNMETTSNNDFDQLEELLRTKQFEELSSVERQWVKSMLSEEEYAPMSAIYSSLNDLKPGIDQEPEQETKNKLDKALSVNMRGSGLFKLKIPLYQSVAAALIFFFVGFGINFSRPVQPKVIHDYVQVIKYINKPENSQKLAIEDPKKKKKIIKKLKTVTEPEQMLENQLENTVSSNESNPEFARSQDIAMTNINQVLNEKNGSSMGSDTLLQKMMVTVY